MLRLRMTGNLIQRFGFEGDVGLAGGFLDGVLFHPGFPAFAGGGVATGESESGDVGVGDGEFFVRVLGKKANDGIFQRGSGAAVEEIAFDFRSVFAGDGDVAAVVEGFFESDADFFVGGELRDPAFEFFVDGAGSELQRVRISGSVRDGLRGFVVDVAGFFACHLSLKLQNLETQGFTEKPWLCASFVQWFCCGRDLD